MTRSSIELAHSPAPRAEHGPARRTHAPGQAHCRTGIVEYDEQYKSATASGAASGSVAGTTSTAANSAGGTKSGTAAAATTATTFKSGSPAPVLTSTPGDGYPTSQTLNTTNPGPVQWAIAQQGRPTLTGGMTSGKVSGTPAQITCSTEDAGIIRIPGIASDDTRIALSQAAVAPSVPAAATEKAAQTSERESSLA
ncbi:hypothetical protein BDR04DRAFT_1234545 [Suillus decipiens]|nr:hypothetical protein BDR04DRAFT_1234545 [Suillus decipiens]